MACSFWPLEHLPLTPLSCFHSHPSFTVLNSFHSHVNTWIQAIQAVITLRRGVSSGTASQDISLWLSLEGVLDAIEAQLRSEEVGFMDALRNAKRFDATVSFTADTGSYRSR